MVSNRRMEPPAPQVPLHDGIYLAVRAEPPVHLPSRPALFLDRDGVIVELVDYLHRPEDVRLTPGADLAIREFNLAEIPVVVVSNQAGIGRGLFDWSDFARTEAEIAAQLARAGAYVDAVVACPFHADGIAPYAHPDHPARKPNPGMFQLARDRLGLSLAASWLVGDNISDVEAADQAGLGGAVHVLTGHGRSFLPDVRSRVAAGRNVRIADSLPAAASMLLTELRRPAGTCKPPP